jgi:peptidoglycan LD-endopeptidase LytH
VKLLIKIIISILIVLAIVGVYFYLRRPGNGGRNLKLSQFFDDPGGHRDWAMKAGARCNLAPFAFPTDGYIGFLWDDSFHAGHHHQGIDIFGGTEPGITPVYTAYDGYLTRLPDWKSSLIIRVPSDPLQPGRQIWTYYTHMADPQGRSFISDQFPPGTNELFVQAGTLLGKQGNFSGDPNSPVGVHLHFSIVKDDANGRFRNELEIANTLDPSPYFDLPLNANSNQGEVPVCRPSKP